MSIGEICVRVSFSAESPPNLERLNIANRVADTYRRQGRGRAALDKVYQLAGLNFRVEQLAAPKAQSRRGVHPSPIASAKPTAPPPRSP